MKKLFKTSFSLSGTSKKIIAFLLILVVFNQSSLTIADDSPTMSEKRLFNLYQERVTEFCSEYKKNDSTSETIYLLDDSNSYKDLSNLNLVETIMPLGDDLKVAKEQYKKNMDSIYNCATYLVTYRAINLVKEKLAKASPALSVKFTPKLEEKLREINQKLASEKNKCKVSGKEESIIKKSVLKQTTYELCRYRFYLEYLKEYNEDVGNLSEDVKSVNDGNSESITINKLVELEKKKMSEIGTEADSIMKAYPVVFKAFSEYENNLVVHILLELLREDFITLREKLHLNLNPINQVVYKIANAMRK